MTESGYPGVMHARRIGSFLALVVASSCSPYELREAAVGDKTPREAGDQLELARFSTTGFARLRPGYFVLQDATDWPDLFHNVTRDFAMPHGPEVDWKTTMGFAVVATDPAATSIVIERVVRAPNDTIHVYVDEELRGDRCEAEANPNVLRAAAHEPPIDVVTFAKKKAPIVLHVDRAKAASCDPVPKVEMVCNVQGKPAGDLTTSMNAAPGDVVECDGTKVTTKVGYVAERNWYFERKPKDSFTQFTIDDAHTHAKFTVDAFGEYRVRLEAEDDRRKSGSKQVEIDVVPPADTQVIQIGWTLHDAIDPKTLPKITPRLVQLGTGRECSEAQAQPPWCEVKVSGLTKQIFVRTQRGSRYQLHVRYEDARAAQMPILCARAFVKTSTVAQETCDMKEREAGDTWGPGIFNPDNGSFGK